MSVQDDQLHRGQLYHEEVQNSRQEPAVRSVSELKGVSSRQDLAAYNLLDMLSLDDRPSFIVDASTAAPDHVSLDLIYCNPSLSVDGELLEKINGKDSPGVVFAEVYSGFRHWLFGNTYEREPSSSHGPYLFEGYIWSATAIDHYKVVSGVQSPATGYERTGSGADGSIASKIFIDPKEHKEPRNFPQFVKEKLPTVSVDTPIERRHSWRLSVPTTKHGPFDYTLDPPPDNMPEHLKYFRGIDWAGTTLGPMRSWSPQLRCLVNMILNDTYPAVLFWGDDAVMIYNESYIEIIGLLHPCMGQSAQVAAGQYWILFQPLVDHINMTGQTLTNHDMPLFLDRHGFLEETYFSFQFIPILDNDGCVAGYYQPLVETTKNNILERRVSSLVEIGSQTAKARDLETYWNLVLDTLAVNDKDAPFALLYAVEHATRTVPSSMSSPGSATELEQCVLKGAIGVDAGHLIAQSAINFKEGSNIFIPYLLKAAKSRRPTILLFEELEMADTLLDSIHWKGYGDPCRCVIVCPILPTTSEQVQGFLILGVNPRRPFDAEYQQFIHVMSRLLATSLASVVLFDEEIRQKEKAIGQAAQIQEQLLAELQLKEKKFQRFAERSDVAIFILDPVGNYTYRNQRWFDIFDIAADQQDVINAWENIAFPEDIAFCEGLFAKLVIDKSPIIFELRTRTRWSPPAEMCEPGLDSHEHYQWILCSAYPELDANNELVEIVGNVTDISKQKWAEGMQKMRTENAVQSKNHLEHFIDTTSHEMRNPLSAIMQCADGILSSYGATAEDGSLPSPTSYANLLEQTLDAAQTIAQCAQHMKRIVDDILTISKIDSGLLVITPIDAQPESVARHAFKMFEGEAKAAGVDMNFVVDQSYRNLEIDWVSLDPTRLLQVLINLITNAVKFTRLEPTRMITVSIAASLNEPKSVTTGVQFIDSKLVTADKALKDDWKQGPFIYLQFSVSDTGCGLSDEEKTTLFSRFSQASPRTHIHYGGSGLGLFISRRLTELQGGAIGLASKFKKGSTFSFYIKARRTAATAVRRSSIPNTYPEDIKHRPHTPREIDRLLSPQKPPTIRMQSAIYSDAPGEPNFKDLKRKNSIPEALYVLIVEDNLVNQKVLAKQLRNLGCVVSVANHGGEALEFLKKTKFWDYNCSTSSPALNRAPPYPFSTAEPPYSCSLPEFPVDLSLILMDWEMPIMNGLTAVAKIRELEKAGMLKGRIPVIGVTANVRKQQIQTAIDAGMDDVVSKPFRVAELLDRMKRVVAGKVDPLRTVTEGER